MQPLVSICIPTYNRCDHLEQTLASILSQEEFQEQLVEVIISDNASTDETGTVGRQYADRYENIHYYRNPENVRDRNFPLALSRGSGMLRTLHKDTLELRDGALRDLCALVRRYESSRPILFLLGSRARSHSNELVDMETAIRALSFYITDIGCFTIWEDDCAGLAEDTAGCEMSLWQVRRFLELASRTDAVYIHSRPYGRVRSVRKKDVSYGMYQVFYVNYLSLLDPYFESGRLRLETREDLERDLLYRFFPHWMVLREQGTQELIYSETEDLNAAILTQYRNKPYYQHFRMYYACYKRLFVVKQWMERILHRQA